MKRKKITIEFVKISFEAEGYTLLSKEYINNKTKLNFLCPKAHFHSISWKDWKKKSRCGICFGSSKSSYNYVKEAFELEGYALLSTEYINNHTNLEYICSNDHKHTIIWNNWCQGYRCPECPEKWKSYKGGIVKRKLSLYNTHNNKLSYCEETRRNPKEEIVLQVRCTKCAKWFSPTRHQVNNRVKALEKLSGTTAAENRFYCSNECKQGCSIFSQKDYGKTHNKENSNFFSLQELQIWSQEVLKRANNTCEYCGGRATNAHHIQPKKLEPFYALDPDNGVACCKTCHYKYGHRDECSTGKLSQLLCN